MDECDGSNRSNDKTGSPSPLTCFCTRARGWSSREETLRLPPGPAPPLASCRLGDAMPVAVELGSADGSALRGGEAAMVDRGGTACPSMLEGVGFGEKRSIGRWME